MCMNCKNQVQINVCPRCRHCPCICNRRRQNNNCNCNSRPQHNCCPIENTTIYNTNNYYVAPTCNKCTMPNNYNNCHSSCNNNATPPCVNNCYDNNNCTNNGNSCNQCNHKCCNSKCKNKCCNNKCCNNNGGCNGLFWLAALALLII